LNEMSPGPQDSSKALPPWWAHPELPVLSPTLLLPFVPGAPETKDLSFSSIQDLALPSASELLALGTLGTG
jgi:hypothetical protein